MFTLAVMTSDFQCTIIVAKRIHDNDIIDISLRIKKQQKKETKRHMWQKTQGTDRTTQIQKLNRVHTKEALRKQVVLASVGYPKKLSRLQQKS